MANIQNSQHIPINALHRTRLSKGLNPGDIGISDQYAERGNSPVCTCHQPDGHERISTVDQLVNEHRRTAPNRKDQESLVEHTTTMNGRWGNRP